MRIRVPSKKVRERFLLTCELEGCRKAVDFLTKHYRVRPMRIILNGRRVGKGYVAYYFQNRAYFTKKGLKKRTVLHEAYHHVLRPSSVCNSQWLFVLTKLKIFRKIAEGRMTGTARQKRVPREFLENIEVPLPPIELQGRFASIMLKTQICQESQRKSTVQVAKLFDSLMFKAFKGELLTLAS